MSDMNTAHPTDNNGNAQGSGQTEATAPGASFDSPESVSFGQDAPETGIPADFGMDATPALDLAMEVERLQRELAMAQAQALTNHENYLRAVAEAENIRRRSADEVSKAHKFAIESFAEALIPARDSLEMALTIPNQTLESLREGVEATLRQLTTGFEKGRLQEINPVGQKFDPHRHQAVSMVPGNSVEPPVASNHVVAVLQKGYLIADRVLRPALVAVAQ